METRYIISDASKIVDVEPHVLRYWEDELSIDIPRNEMGHRYYTEHHLILFKRIKTMKDKGYLLKAIKMVLPELEKTNETDSALDFSNISTLEDNTLSKKEKSPIVISSDTDSPIEDSVSSDEKLTQFENILSNIISKAIISNNESMTKDISSNVTTSVIKEMDYLLRVRDDLEEERFKKLDEYIRLCQQKNKPEKRKLFKKRPSK